MLANERRPERGTLVANVVIQGATILQGLMLARMLGPEGRGQFALIVLWPTFFSGLGLVGMNMGFARLAGIAGGFTRLTKSAILYGSCSGCLTAAVCALCLPLLLTGQVSHVQKLAFAFLFYIPISHIGQLLQSVDHGSGRIAWLNVTRVVLYPVTLVGLLLAAMGAGNQLFGALAALVAGNLACLLLRLWGRRESGWLRGHVVSPARIAGESLPFLGANLLSSVYSHFDRVILVALLTDAEMGIYVAALAPAGAVSLVSRSFGLVLFARSAQEQPGEGFQQVADSLRHGGVSSVVAAAALALLLPSLIPIVYGSDFAGAVEIALALLPVATIAGLTNLLEQSLRGQGVPLVTARYRVLGLLVIGGASPLSVQLLGPVGVAVSFLLGEAVILAGVMHAVTRHYEGARMAAFLPRYTDIREAFTRIIR